MQAFFEVELPDLGVAIGNHLGRNVVEVVPKW
jgi:hypothetical protein